jgi:hypothetical protein
MVDRHLIVYIVVHHSIGMDGKRKESARGDNRRTPEEAQLMREAKYDGR